MALVIVDLGHVSMMPPSWPGHRAAFLAGVARDSIYIYVRYDPGERGSPGS